jgi:hypothetical protein
MRKIVAIFSILLLGVAVGHAQQQDVTLGVSIRNPQLIKRIQDKEFFLKWRQELEDICQERARILGHKRAAMWIYHDWDFVESQQFIELEKERLNTFHSWAKDSLLNLSAERVRPQSQFATAAEAEAFLRANYSFYATAYPDDHTEIVRRFVALLETRLTLTRAERKFFRNKREIVAVIAGLFNPRGRIYELEHLLKDDFSDLRRQEIIDVVSEDNSQLFEAEECYIDDYYKGYFESGTDSHDGLLMGGKYEQKAIAIHLIYGVKPTILYYDIFPKVPLH